MSVYHVCVPLYLAGGLKSKLAFSESRVSSFQQNLVGSDSLLRFDLSPAYSPIANTLTHFLITEIVILHAHTYVLSERLKLHVVLLAAEYY